MLPWTTCGWVHFFEYPPVLFDERQGQKEIICCCSGTTKEKIKTLIDSNRANNIGDISRITGACSGCGTCDTTILELIAEYD